MNRELEHEKIISHEKTMTIEELKDNLNKMHEDHAREMSKMMSESRVKRRSMKNLSEISSLRDLAGDNSGNPSKKIFARQNSINQEGSSGQLYTVHE